MSAPVVSLQGIELHRGGRRVISVPACAIGGGLTAVVGPNGSGKSTLLRAVATVGPIAHGGIYVDGLDLTDARLRAAVRRRLVYVPQRIRFPRRARVFDALDVIAVCRELAPESARRRAVLEALDAVGLAERAAHRCGQLSAGQHQRLGLASALLGPAELVVLDEPEDGLDVGFRRQVDHLLDDLASRATVITSTQLLAERLPRAHRVIVLDRGVVVFDGPPRDLAARAAEAGRPGTPEEGYLTLVPPSQPDGGGW